MVTKSVVKDDNDSADIKFYDNYEYKIETFHFELWI